MLPSPSSSPGSLGDGSAAGGSEGSGSSLGSPPAGSLGSGEPVEADGAALPDEDGSAEDGDATGADAGDVELVRTDGLGDTVTTGREVREDSAGAGSWTIGSA